MHDRKSTGKILASVVNSRRPDGASDSPTTPMAKRRHALVADMWGWRASISTSFGKLSPPPNHRIRTHSRFQLEPKRAQRRQPLAYRSGLRTFRDRRHKNKNNTCRFWMPFLIVMTYFPETFQTPDSRARQSPHLGKRHSSCSDRYMRIQRAFLSPQYLHDYYLLSQKYGETGRAQNVDMMQTHIDWLRDSPSNGSNYIRSAHPDIDGRLSLPYIHPELRFGGCQCHKSGL